MPQQHETSWIYFLIRHRTFALTIGVFLCLGLSLASWFQIPVEVMPKENTPPFLFLRVNAKEASSPDRIELGLTLYLEGAVRTLPQVLKMTSNTNNQGASLSITYKPRTNLDMAELNLQEALQELETKGILEMKRVSISRLNPDATAVMRLSVSYGTEIRDPVQTIKEDLRIGLESIAEVSKIEISGIEPLEFEYRIPASRAAELGLQGAGFSKLLSSEELREPIGESFLGSAQYLKSINARMGSLDLFGLQSQFVSKNSTMTLQQVATEKVRDKSKEEISRKNGETAVFIEIFAKEGANLFSLNDHVQEYLEKIRNQTDELSHLRFEPIFNRTEDLRHAIDDVFESLFEAILITLAVVFVFIRKWRPTLLISLTIPATLLMTILVLYLRGVSLNVLTLSGLILGIGMVVDSAILVVGRITELKAQGRDLKAAAAEGAQDVFSALLMSTLTNAAIFMPVAFLEGGDSFTDILMAFQLPILASLGTSLIVALFMLPLAMVHWKSASESPEEESAQKKVVSAFRWIQSKRLQIAMGSLILVISVGKWIFDIEQTDLETPRDPFATMSVQFAPEVPSEQRKKLFSELETLLLSQQSRIQYKFLVADYNPVVLNGSFSFFPNKADDPDQELVRLEQALKAWLHEQKKVPGFFASVGWESMGKSSTQLVSDSFRFTGPKMSKLISLNEELKMKISKLEGLSSVRLEHEESGEKSLVFLPHETVLLGYGLTLKKVSNSLSTMLNSASISNLNLNGRSVGARISFEPSTSKWNLESLLEMKIPVSERHFANLSDLGVIVPRSFPGGISRKDGVASARMSVYYDPQLSAEALSQVRQKVRKQVQSFQFPHGYGVPQSDSAARILEMQQKSNFIIGLSALLIYLLLAAMFESVLLPFAILFTVPLALLFGVAGLKALGFELDVMARLSLIILVGIGVNSAIILIDLITGLRREGMTRRDAVAFGCARRLKAVVMTASIQIISVLPVAMGKAKIMGIPYSSLGVAIMSGMLFSTLLTLVVLPMVYELLDELEERIKSVLGLKSKSESIESSSDQVQAA